MSDDHKPSNGDVRPDPVFIDPVTGEPRPAGEAPQGSVGWLPPASPASSESAGPSEYGGWLPPASGPHVPITPSPRIVTVQREYAGWWSRVGANIIDSFIITIPVAILAAIIYFGLIHGSVTWSDDRESFQGSLGAGKIVVIVVASIIALIYAVGYAPFWMARTNGQTIGKQVASIRVIRVDGQPVSFWFAAAREIGLKGLAVGTAGQLTIGIASVLNYLWPLWDAENRAVHDLIIKTRVVKVTDVPPTEV